jgi:hypothetical protein
MDFHKGKAALAAATAASTSRADEHGATATTSSVSAGLRLSMVSPDAADVHAPLIKFPIRSAIAFWV